MTTNPLFLGDAGTWCPNCDINLQHNSRTALHVCPLCGHDPNPRDAA